MSKQIKPGMLCIVNGLVGECKFPGNSPNGKIVQVVRRPAIGELFKASKGTDMMWEATDGADAWVVESSELLSWYTGLLKQRVIRSDKLTPINDPDIELTEDIATIMQQKDKFVAEQHRNRVE